MKKNTNSSPNNAISKLKSLVKNRESARIRLEKTAKQLEITAKQLAIIAEEKEKIRIELEATAEDLAIAKATDEAMLESIGDGVLATDEKGYIILINKVAEKLLDKKSEEIMGKFFLEVLFLEDENEIIIPVEKHPVNLALTTGATRDIVYYYKKNDITRFPIAITCSPVVLKGKVVGAINVFRDITQEKEIDRSKSEFVSVASHQLKTPATIVNFYTEKLLNNSNSIITAKQKDYINEIRDANQRMIEIVNTLLNVSRIEMGIFPIDPMPVDVIEILKNVLRESQTNREKKNLTLQEKYHRPKHMVPIDALMLKMIFSNLISNAIKYTSPGDNIFIETSEVQADSLVYGKMIKKDSLLINVSDNGCGIPINQQNKIFTKFFRSDNARRQDTDGTGLGLYIVKSILDHTGGDVWFSSKEQEGTSFYFIIPLNNLKNEK